MLNRLQYVLLKEAMSIVEEGVAHAVTPESYDAALAWFERWLNSK